MSVQGLRRQALGNVDSPLTQTRNRPFEIRLVPTYLTGMAPRRCGSEAHSLRALARCREVAWPGNAFPGLMGAGGAVRGVRQAVWAAMAKAVWLWISQTAWLALHSKQYYCQTRLRASSGHGELKEQTAGQFSNASCEPVPARTAKATHPTHTYTGCFSDGQHRQACLGKSLQ